MGISQVNEALEYSIHENQSLLWLFGRLWTM